MSFIQQTLRCKHCKLEFNVALGTFGYGLPEKCPQYGYLADQFEKISDGWNAKEKRSLWLRFLIWFGARSPCCGAKIIYWDAKNCFCEKCNNRII